MKTITNLLVTFLLLHQYSYGQTFSNQYSSIGGAVSRVIKTNNGRIVLLDGQGQFLTIANNSGNSDSCHFVSFPCHTVAKGFLFTPHDTTYAVLEAGFSDSLPILYWKADYNGNFLWAKSLNYSSSESPTSLAVMPDGGLVISGDGCLTRNFIVRTDKDGNPIWQKQYIDTSTVFSSTRDLSIQSNKRITAVDEMYRNGFYNISLYQLDSSGQVRWHKLYENESNNHPIQIIGDESGFTIFGKYTLDTAMRTFILRTDTIGNLKWFKVYDDSTNNEFYRAIELADHTYIFTSLNYAGYFYQTRVNSDGETIWSRKMAWSYGYGPVAVDDNNYFLGAGLYKAIGAGQGGWCARIAIDSSSFCGSSPAVFNILQPTLYQYTSTLQVQSIVFATPQFYVNKMTMSVTTTGVCGYLPTAVNYPLAEYPIVLYPNPAGETLYLDLDNNISSTTFQLFNIQGMLMQTNTVTDHSQIDIAPLADGIYFYELRNANGVIKKGKVIKQ